jgi:hypothetical protein
LMLDQLRREAKQAGDIIKQALSSGQQGTADAPARTAKGMEELEKKTRRATTAIRDQNRALADAIRAGQGFPGQRNINFWGAGMQGVPPGQGQSAGSTPWQNPVGSGGSLATKPGPAPVPPVMRIQKTAQTAAQGINAALSTPLAVMAQVGAALAGLRVAVGLVKYAFDKLLVPIRAIFAIANAQRQLYAGALGAGQSTQFAVATGSLASVMGVGSNEVMHYAQAIQVLSEKMRFSVSVMQETNRPLTYLSWNLNTLKASFASVIAVLATSLAPSFNRLIDVTRSAADALANSGLIEDLAKLAGVVISLAAINVGIASAISQTMQLITTAFIEGLQYFARQVLNSISRTFGGEINADDMFKKTKKSAEILAATLKNTFMRPRDQNAPEALGSANRLASSAWERMGLVVGSPAIDMAKLQLQEARRQTKLLESIAGIGTLRIGSYGANPSYSQP